MNVIGVDPPKNKSGGDREGLRRTYVRRSERDWAYMSMPRMPPMPPPGPPAGASFFSGISVTMHSVVSSRPAIEAAFCRAVRVTFAVSMTPAATRSSYFSVAALKPKLSLPSRTYRRPDAVFPGFRLLAMSV